MTEIIPLPENIPDVSTVNISFQKNPNAMYDWYGFILTIPNFNQAVGYDSSDNSGMVAGPEIYTAVIEGAKRTMEVLAEFSERPDVFEEGYLNVTIQGATTVNFPIEEEEETE